MDRRSNGKAGSNTHVRTTTEGSVDVYLHDNQIAHLNKDGKLFITDAGCISYMNPSQWYEVSRKQYGKEVVLPKFSRKALATARGAA